MYYCMRERLCPIYQLGLVHYPSMVIVASGGARAQFRLRARSPLHFFFPFDVDGFYDYG